MLLAVFALRLLQAIAAALAGDQGSWATLRRNLFPTISVLRSRVVRLLGRQGDFRQTVRGPRTQGGTQRHGILVRRTKT